MSKKTNIPKHAFKVKWSIEALFNEMGDKKRRGVGWISRNYPYHMRVLWDGRQTTTTYHSMYIHCMNGKVKP